MYEIVICDDERSVFSFIEENVKRGLGSAEARITFYEDAETLISEVQKGRIMPDIAVMDIEMPGMDGITAARKLNKAAPGCIILFLTGYIEYCVDAYDAEHFRFITKERLEERLPEAVRQAIERIGAEKADYVAVRTKGNAGALRIPCKSVLYLERKGRSTLIRTDTETLQVSAHPDEITAGREGFIRCHQSYWVNGVRVRTMEQAEFLLDNGERIAISRTYGPEAKRSFLRQLFP